MLDVFGSSRRLRKRLRSEIHMAKMAEHDHLPSVPRSGREGFNSFIKMSDILLNLIGYSGLNTTMQAIGSCVPIVTREHVLQELNMLA